MRRLQLALFVVVLPLLVVSLTLSGCKKPEENTNVGDDGSGGGGGGGGVKPAGAKMTGIKMGNGVIKGKVVLKGGKPDLEKMNASLKAQIEAKDDKAVCLAGTPEEIHQQHYRIGPEPDNTVGNVFVWVMPVDSRGSYFEFSKEDLDKLKVPKMITIGQPHCAFEPHVDLAFPSYADPKNPKKMIPTGQVVDIVNNATISHNTKWDEVGRITSGNKLLPQGDKLALPLVPESAPLRISCSIHPWMDGYIWSLSHPYADITKSPTSPAKIKPDDPSYGTYEIKNVPTGVKLKLIAWHEEAQFLTPDRKIAGAPDIELKDGETLTKDFEMEASK
jgi:hypothetical protein